MGPQSRPAEFSSSRPPGTRGTSREMLEHALDPGPNAAADFVLDACTFRGQSATIGSPAARRPGAEGGRRGVVGGVGFCSRRSGSVASLSAALTAAPFVCDRPAAGTEERPSPSEHWRPRLSSHVTTRPDRAARPRATERTRTGECATVLVLKHGPRSLISARVKGLDETQRRNESETEASALGEFAFRVAWSPTRGWDPRRRFIAAARGAPPARLDRTRQ